MPGDDTPDHPRRRRLLDRASKDAWERAWAVLRRQLWREANVLCDASQFSDSACWAPPEARPARDDAADARPDTSKGPRSTSAARRRDSIERLLGVPSYLRGREATKEVERLRGYLAQMLAAVEEPDPYPPAHLRALIRRKCAAALRLDNHDPAHAPDERLGAAWRAAQPEYEQVPPGSRRAVGATMDESLSWTAHTCPRFLPCGRVRRGGRASWVGGCL